MGRRGEGETGRGSSSRFCASPLLPCPITPLCYTFIGSLEWVGRLLALLFVISDLRFRFEISDWRERKVRTPEGNGLANRQAG